MNSEKTCLLEFPICLYVVVKSRNECCERRMENKVTKSCKRKFLIPEILDKPSELRSKAVFVRWDMTVQDTDRETRRRK